MDKEKALENQGSKFREDISLQGGGARIPRIFRIFYRYKVDFLFLP